MMLLIKDVLKSIKALWEYINGAKGKDKICWEQRKNYLSVIGNIVAMIPIKFGVNMLKLINKLTNIGINGNDWMCCNAW